MERVACAQSTKGKASVLVHHEYTVGEGLPWKGVMMSLSGMMERLKASPRRQRHLGAELRDRVAS